jgi:hypothetical protein
VYNSIDVTPLEKIQISYAVMDQQQDIQPEVEDGNLVGGESMGRSGQDMSCRKSSMMVAD